MKRIIKLIVFNLITLLLLWTLSEIVLQSLGWQTPAEETRAILGQRYQAFCKKIATGEKVVFFDSFHTGSDAIFRANKRFDFNASKKTRGVFINAEGFRGNEFTPNRTNRRSIFLAGDSFVWGAAAEPLQNCFADRLQAAGYHIWNSGVPGTDPMQYLRVIQKYAPRLKPDVIAVCIYLGNDIKTAADPVLPNHNLHYVTNFGFLQGYDSESGRYFKDAEEAFHFFRTNYCRSGGGLFNFIRYHTLLGKLLMKRPTKNPTFKQDPKKLWVRQSLLEMQRISDSLSAEFLVFIVPSLRERVNRNISAENNMHLFRDLPVCFPPSFAPNDYCVPPNDHFNNQGHRKYAEFMLRILKEKGLPPEKENRRPGD